MTRFTLPFYCTQLFLHLPWILIAAVAVFGFIRSRRFANLIQCAGAAVVFGVLILDWLMLDPNFGLLQHASSNTWNLWRWANIALQSLGFLLFIAGYVWDKLTVTRPSASAGFPVANPYATTSTTHVR